MKHWFESGRLGFTVSYYSMLTVYKEEIYSVAVVCVAI